MPSPRRVPARCATRGHRGDAHPRGSRKGHDHHTPRTRRQKAMEAPISSGNYNAPLKPVERVLSHLGGAHRSGNGWIARCPHHDDRHASLSVRECDDGRVLLHCHEECPTVDVVCSAGPGRDVRLEFAAHVGEPGEFAVSFARTRKAALTHQPI